MREERGSGLIVVGLTGDGDDWTILAEGLREAARRALPLCVVRALGTSDYTPGPAFEAAIGQTAATQTARESEVRRDLQRRIDRVVADVAPAVVTDCKVVYGDPATVILEEARGPGVIVIGAGDSGRESPLLLGRICQDVTVHARCPVLVVPPTERSPIPEAATTAAEQPDVCR
jgi:nucleotide-binding universal stress UspA family protein